MDVYARAGIDIHGTVLRYAEVERRGSRYHLLRLGSCDFDFDLADEVLHARDPERLEALNEALADVFEDSMASRVHVTLHPPNCYSFFTPLPIDLKEEDRKERVLGEAALLMRSVRPQPLRLTADPVYTETLLGGYTIEWFHVLALPEPLQARFDRILRTLPQTSYRMALSMHAVANAVERIERRVAPATHGLAPFSLAIGWYEGHIEYTLCRHSRWYFSHFAESTSPSDAAYFALLLLERLKIDPGAIGRLYMYGEHAEEEAFSYLQAAFDIEPEHLNPMQLVELDPGSMAADFNADAYAPCLGVVL